MLRRPKAERRRRDQRGAVAIIAGVMMLALVITGGIVLDFGLARMERTTNKSAADAAVAAGVQSANNGTGDVYNSRAVCTALEFLKANRRSLSGLPAGVCATVSDTATCSPDLPASSVSYQGTTTSGGTTFTVWIKMPYSVSDTTTGGAFADESLATLSTDPGESTQNGCDQIGVVIKEETQPGFGKIVSPNAISTRVRSVARVKVGNGDPAPALLLLERTRCNVLSVGSAGSAARIKVYGNATSPGTIHSDSDATDSACGPGNQLLQGKQAGGVVAYGSLDGTPGIITTVATQNGVIGATTVTDSPLNVFPTTAASESVIGTPSTVTGRKGVTRKPVDKRYLAGLSAATVAAKDVWALDHTNPTGYLRYGCPTPAEMTTLGAMSVSQSVYIDCPGGMTSTGTIGAGTVYLHGYFKSGVLNLSNAQKVYIDDTDNTGGRASSDAIGVSNNNAFCVRATTCAPGTPASGQCSTLPTGSAQAKARVIVRRGGLGGSGTNSLLRLCNTTMILEGGDVGLGTAASPGGCLPTVIGIAPTSTPCPSSAAGDALINTSGVVDWTAPNAFADMTALGLSVSQQQSLWSDGEDLAAWDETYGTGADYKLAGGASIHVGGVFMVPNAWPFGLAGGGAQDLTNAQFVVRGFSVAGGATLTMKVDPSNVVGLPSLYDFRIVR
jgi:Flp pilus assembly protein TadG